MAQGASVAFLIMIAAGVPAAILLVWFLRGLQRRFRIFTRGTVTFMVVVMMVTAVVSTFDHLHSIKRTEQRMRSVAQHRTVASFLSTWMLDGVGAASRQFGSEETSRRILADDCLAVEERVRQALQETNAPAESMRDLTLVSLWADERGGPAVGRSATRAEWEWSWPFSALFEDGRTMHLVRGRIFGTPHESSVMITGVEGDVVREARRRTFASRCRRAFSRANVYRNERYDRRVVAQRTSYRR